MGRIRSSSVFQRQKTPSARDVEVVDRSRQRKAERIEWGDASDDQRGEANSSRRRSFLASPPRYPVLLCRMTVLASASSRVFPCRHHASVRGQRVVCRHCAKSKSSSRVPIFQAYSDRHDLVTRMTAASSGTASRHGTSVSLRTQTRPICPFFSSTFCRISEIIRPPLPWHRPE